MEQQINDIIKQHLPEKVAGEMRDFLNKAEDLKRENEVLKEKVKLKDKHLKDREESIDKLRDDLCSARDVIKEFNNRESFIANEEIRLREKELNLGKKEILIACAEARVNDMKELTALVFNTKIERKTYREFPMVNRSYNDNYWNPTTGNQETRVEENLENHLETTTEIQEGL